MKIVCYIRFGYQLLNISTYTIFTCFVEEDVLKTQGDVFTRMSRHPSAYNIQKNYVGG